jgi:hypothetical protein
MAPMEGSIARLAAGLPARGNDYTANTLNKLSPPFMSSVLIVMLSTSRWLELDKRDLGSQESSGQERSGSNKQATVDWKQYSKFRDGARRHRGSAEVNT